MEEQNANVPLLTPYRMGKHLLSHKWPVHRPITFCKHRSGLLKKANELSVLCDADIWVFIFSPHAKLYELTTKGNYWRDSDTALFILKHLYRDIHEKPLSAKSSAVVKRKTGFASSWREAKEAAEEELPLTFYDANAARSLSGKAKKVVKI